ncbi:hypothetical protein Nepgr_020639 [Nepenthes gracilis]|uniref:Mechanosensitive ion channel MscS domain-containing protein n=1 Tax=Nepenthes gracilis TaxID=150966 RepID=A0AAD3SVM0_NEPGR|nr:hypothetical protein Nepgr_020639 [Nepenthes gracilis]
MSAAADTTTAVSPGITSYSTMTVPYGINDNLPAYSTPSVVASSPEPSRDSKISSPGQRKSSLRYFGCEDREEGPNEAGFCERIQAASKIRKKRERMIWLSIPSVMLVWTLGFLVATFTVPKLKRGLLTGLQLWKWALFFVAVVSGSILIRCLIYVVVKMIQMKFSLEKNVFYFLSGLRKSIEVLIWWLWIFLTWLLLLESKIKQSSSKSTTILDFTTQSLATLVIGALLWVLVTVGIKLLGVKCHHNRYLENCGDAIYCHYLLQTLSRLPGKQNDERKRLLKISNGEISSRKGQRVIDVDKIRKIESENMTFLTLNTLIDVVQNFGLSITDSIEEISIEEISNEDEAKNVASTIFNHVSGNRCSITEDDLGRFLIKEEIEGEHVLQLIGGKERREIEREVFTSWVVGVYNDHKSLARILNDNKTAVKQLGKLLRAIVVICCVVCWLLWTNILKKNLLVAFATYVLALSFIFQETAKTIFASIIFVFLTHPFDVGDRCIIDDTQMVVDEMNILTTVFLKSNNEKVYYPNSVLATKAISNLYRSPPQADCLEFSINFMTPANTIAAIKDKFRNCLEQNKEYWNPAHSVVVKFEDMESIKLVLHFKHNVNFQDYEEISRRRSELVLQLKEFLEVQNIPHKLST